MWGAKTYEYIGTPFPDCSRCRLPSCTEQRINWGCDRPTDRPVFQIGCSACGGTDLACISCDGRGVVDMYQCPTAILKGARPDMGVQVDLAIRAYLHYDGRGALPVAGGFADQSRSFIAACEIIDGERGRLEQLKEVKAQREVQAQKARSHHGRR